MESIEYRQRKRELNELKKVIHIILKPYVPPDVFTAIADAIDRTYIFEKEEVWHKIYKDFKESAGYQLFREGKEPPI